MSIFAHPFKTKTLLQQSFTNPGDTLLQKRFVLLLFRVPSVIAGNGIFYASDNKQLSCLLMNRLTLYVLQTHRTSLQKSNF
jgi:hypothetical protein